MNTELIFEKIAASAENGLTVKLARDIMAKVNEKMAGSPPVIHALEGLRGKIPAGELSNFMDNMLKSRKSTGLGEEAMEGFKLRSGAPTPTKTIAQPATQQTSSIAPKPSVKGPPPMVGAITPENMPMNSRQRKQFALDQAIRNSPRRG